MALTATYVKSVNGIAPDDERNLVLDSKDIRVSGSSGNTIYQRIQTLSAGVRPLVLTQTETDGDYKLSVLNGIPVLQG